MDLRTLARCRTIIDSRLWARRWVSTVTGLRLVEVEMVQLVCVMKERVLHDGDGLLFG